MSWEPEASAAPGDTVETVLIPRSTDLSEGLTVHRALPAAERRMIGPFIFFDRIGPATLPRGRGLDVRPHPHIGLATTTYLFTGEILHRDSLGCVQPIRPGEVNWMTAGRGIAHSERTPQQARQDASPLSGIQTWVALPQRHEETVPSFSHHDTHELPLLEGEGKRVRLITGEIYGAHSPVPAWSDMFYVDVTLERGATLAVPADHAERGMYLIEGEVEVTGGARFGVGELVVFRPGGIVVLRAAEAPARLVLIGGEPMDGPRHIWWNFVSSSRDRIEQAKEDWRAGRFTPVPEEHEFIPLPEGPAQRPVSYP